MKNEKNAIKDLDALLVQGDTWLLRHGIVTPQAHNGITLNIYIQFPKVKYLEYYLDPEDKKIDLTLYLPFWTLLFTNKERLIDDIFVMLAEYLEDYENFFKKLVKKNLINLPLVKALKNISKKEKIKVIFLTSNLKEYGEIISNKVLKLIGERGKFYGAVGSEYFYEKNGKAIGVKSLKSSLSRIFSSPSIKSFTRTFAFSPLIIK